MGRAILKSAIPVSYPFKHCREMMPTGAVVDILKIISGEEDGIFEKAIAYVQWGDFKGFSPLENLEEL